MFGYFDSMIRYFELSGRTSRTQFWMFQICHIALIVAAVYADFKLNGVVPDREHLGFFTLFAILVHAVPGITVTVRRLHDSGRSGWWYWISLVPLIGSLWLLVLLCLGPDTMGDNGYGPDPRDGGGPRSARPVKLSRAQQMIGSMEARRTASLGTFGRA